MVWRLGPNISLVRPNSSAVVVVGFLLTIAILSYWLTSGELLPLQDHEEIDGHVNYFKQLNSHEVQSQNLRRADKISPYYIVTRKRKELLTLKKVDFIDTGVSRQPEAERSSNNGNIDKLSHEEIELLMQWHSNDLETRRLVRCKLLIAALYENDINWTNEDLFQGSSDGDEIEDQQKVQVLIERGRLYDYCFLKGDLDAREVFDTQFFKSKGIDAYDYQFRMFPFLSRNLAKSGFDGWPTFFDVSSGDLPLLVDMTPEARKSDTPKFNANFMKSWRKLSQGRGIVTTMKASSIPYFGRALRLFQYLNNTLPIQVVYTGAELSGDTLRELNKVAKSSNQQVYMLNLLPVLNDTLVSSIGSFQHKLFATLFNSFEEALFVDADAVTFQKPEEFFNEIGYNRSGIYLYRDRQLEWESVNEFCPKALQYSDPSIEERIITGSTMFIDRGYLDEEPDFGDGQVYRAFFERHRKHHVDSGLIVMNKKQKFNGLLMSLLMYLSPLLTPCSWGDKEFYWLGQLMAGEDFAVDDFFGGVAGPLTTSFDEEKQHRKYRVCSIQLSHINDKGELVWINGGMKTCKIEGAAKKDFAEDRDWFTTAYGGRVVLRNFYRKPLSIEAFMIPNPASSPWETARECRRFMYCGSAFDGNRDHMIVFSNEQKHRYNEISRIWNKDLFPGIIPE